MKTLQWRYSKEDTFFKRRHTLWPILKIAVKMDKFKEKAKLKHDKLILDGIEYGVEDLDNLQDDMSTLSSCQKSNDNTIAFFGQHSPFSNFYQASFEHDGHHFNTAEHAIQHTKAIMFEDVQTVERILESDSVKEAKPLVRKVRNFEMSKWQIEGLAACYLAIKQKYSQNPSVKNYLLSTGTKP